MTAPIVTLAPAATPTTVSPPFPAALATPITPHGPDVVTGRVPEAGVDPLFLRRWSPRAFREDTVPRSVLHSIVEAARWAPSSANLQPWRFFVATRGPVRDALDQALAPNNRTWASKAPVLVLVAARKAMGPNPWSPPETPNRHAWFDTGMATIQLVLQAERHGLRSHIVGGFDAQAARDALATQGLDEGHDLVAAIAIGYPGDASSLPEALQKREHASSRKPAADVAHFV